jgi:hypothetical protein
MIRNLFLVALAATLAPTMSLAQDQQTSDASVKMYILPHPRPIPAPPGDGWVWIPPTYRTIYDRVWTQPVYRTVTETVWIPDQFGWRTTCYWENGQYVQREEWTLLTPAHAETRTHQIQISPSGWTWVTRQEVVTPGHWEWRGTTPPPPPQPQPWPQPMPPHGPTTRPPGLEPFSPLWEWPADSKK